MEDLSRALNEALWKEMECPVCMEYMVPPIKLCMNGHSTCSKCKESIQCCPTCRASFTEIRNVVLENIAISQKYPCANKRNGCLELLSIEHIAKHQAGCVFGKIKCPLHLVQTCSWNGLKNNLMEHVKSKHYYNIHQEPKFGSPTLTSYVTIVPHFGELFTYYKQKKDGRYYCAVQLIGISSEASKYKCEFTLRAANGIEQISNTFLVQGYSEDWETIFNSGICLCFDEKIVRHFLEEGRLKLDVTLSRV